MLIKLNIKMEKEKTEKTEVNPNVVSIGELNILSSLLSKCTNNRETKASTVVTVMRLKKQIEKLLVQTQEEITDVLNEYDVPTVEIDGKAVKSWVDHKDASKISALINEIQNSKFELTGLHSISDEELINHTRGLAENEVSFLWDYLVEN